MYTCCTCLYLHTHLLLLLMYVVCIFSSVVCKFNMIIWWQTDRRTDGRNYYLLYQYRVSVLTRDKNWNVSCHMAEYCHNSWSKCPPSARTHARRRPHMASMRATRQLLHCQWWSGQCRKRKHWWLIWQQLYFQWYVSGKSTPEAYLYERSHRGTIPSR